MWCLPPCVHVHMDVSLIAACSLPTVDMLNCLSTKLKMISGHRILICHIICNDHWSQTEWFDSLSNPPSPPLSANWRFSTMLPWPECSIPAADTPDWLPHCHSWRLDFNSRFLRKPFKSHLSRLTVLPRETVASLEFKTLHVDIGFQADANSTGPCCLPHCPMFDDSMNTVVVLAKLRFLLFTAVTFVRCRCRLPRLHTGSSMPCVTCPYRTYSIHRTLIHYVLFLIARLGQPVTFFAATSHILISLQSFTSVWGLAVYWSRPTFILRLDSNLPPSLR